MTRNPICVKCSRGMRPHRNGVSIVETCCAEQKAYTISSGDVYKCPQCGTQIVTGFGKKTYHHEGYKFNHYMKIALEDKPVVEFEENTSDKEEFLEKMREEYK